MSTAPDMLQARRTLLLNGWWDFLPLPHADLAVHLSPAEVPMNGWEEAAYLVPGFFTDHAYPEHWCTSRAGWARTRFTLDAVDTTMRAFLTIGAAIPEAHIFLNGRKLAVQQDMFIGDVLDVTAYLQLGENELAVCFTEFQRFPHPETGKPTLLDVPWGCCIAHEQAGIWQDVELEWRAAVHVEEVTIRTSTRENTFTVITRVRNAGETPFAGPLRQTVEDDGAEVLALPATEITLAAGETGEMTLSVPWTDYRPWRPSDPHLYHLRLELPGDLLRERFGFREVWIEGHRVLLNGKPQRWAGEWCHKAHSHWLRPEYVRQWYGQVKDLNMNYVRMHTYPHPEYFLDIADEMGMMVCQESALHGSGQWATDGAGQLWSHARAHVRRMVRRDKNHPSLVLWSVENEMRWALNIMPSAREELPKLRALFNEIDPTRPAYHDGDSAMWDEHAQALISRHYGAACHGLGWWERDVPLHAGEVGRWHYASPYVATVWGGDAVFTDYALVSQAVARDAARVIELGRANEVTCLFVWNTSGLDNFRCPEAKTFDWPEPNSRYLKPLAHKPYESEYAWWRDDAGYRPGFSFARIRQAFRPLAIVIREERTQFYTNRPLTHTVSVVNDLPWDADGILTVQLLQGARMIWQESRALPVESGRTGLAPWEISLADALPGTVTVLTTYQAGEQQDEARREIRLAAPAQRATPLTLPPVGLLGPSALQPWLAGHGITPLLLDDAAILDPAVTPLLIVAEHSVLPNSTQNRRLRDFARAGGRVLLLEQKDPLFPGLALQSMPVEMACIRAAEHPALDGLTSEDFRFFGDDPFGLPSSDSWVTVYPYLKPTDQHVVRPLVDSSGGDIGTGGLPWTPLCESAIGDGLIVASQLRLTDRWEELPLADHLFSNILRYLAAYRPVRATAGCDARMAALLAPLETGLPFEELTAALPEVTLFSGDTPPAQHAVDMAAHVAAGNTVLVWQLTEATRAYWEAVIGRPIEVYTPEHTVYHLIAAEHTPLLWGISNEDTCWIDNWAYLKRPGSIQPIVEQLLSIDGATIHLQSGTRAALDVLFGDRKDDEWRRMPTLTQYFDGTMPRVGGGLLEAPVGQGRVLFCQVRWLPEFGHFRRFLGLLAWNLGVRTTADILAGEHTPTSGMRSDGSPTQMRVARGVSEESFADLLSRSERVVEFFTENLNFKRWPAWQETETPGGIVPAALASGDGALVIGLLVECPEARKFMYTVGGWPNPDLQTFLRAQGDGTLRAWVNGVAWGDPLTLAPERGDYVADIDFEAGANFVVLTWEPATAESTLSLRFDNKDRRPETTFAFPLEIATR